MSNMGIDVYYEHPQLWLKLMLIPFLVALGACSQVGGSEPVTYALTTNAVPAEGGSISPESGEFEEGSTVEVEATANDNWQFVNWTGDIESTDNSLIFAIEQNTELTANFLDTRSEYTVTLNVADANDQLELEFGQHTHPFEMDEEAPPPPPKGALNAYFERSSEKYFKDYRSDTEKEVTWQLYYQSGSGEALTLTWQIDASKMQGTLSLMSPDNSLLISDMSEENTFGFQADDYDYLNIYYQLE